MLLLYDSPYCLYLGFVVLFTFASLILLRVVFLVFLNKDRGRVQSQISNRQRKDGRKIRTIVVMGSGGHTMEMLKLMRGINRSLYQPRFYIVADSDSHSEQKILQFEGTGNDNQNATQEYSLHRIPRSRNVGQLWITSVYTTMMSIFSCIPLVLRLKPDLILANGPGTCVPICLIGFALKVFFLRYPIIIYVESICRVKSLSLSGKILRIFGDHLIVQWPELQSKYPESEYIGKIM